MKRPPFPLKTMIDAGIKLLAFCLFLSCASYTTVNQVSVKNITDYFNILSGQKIVRGRIITEKGNYVIKMQDCDDLRNAKIDIKLNRIYYTFSIPCAGPPPDYIIVVSMAVSDDKTVFMHVTSRELTFGDRESDYYKLNAAEFVKVEKEELPEEVSAAFKLSDY